MLRWNPRVQTRRTIGQVLGCIAAFWGRRTVKPLPIRGHNLCESTVAEDSQRRKCDGQYEGVPRYLSYSGFKRLRPLAVARVGDLLVGGNRVASVVRGLGVNVPNPLRGLPTRALIPAPDGVPRSVGHSATVPRRKHIYRRATKVTGSPTKTSGRARQDRRTWDVRETGVCTRESHRTLRPWATKHSGWATPTSRPFPRVSRPTLGTLRLMKGQPAP